MSTPFPPTQPTPGSAQGPTPMPGTPSPGPQQPYPPQQAPPQPGSPYPQQPQQPQQPVSPYPGSPSPWPAQPASPYGPVPPAPPGRSRKGLVVVIVLLAAVGIVGGGFLLTRDDGGGSPEEAMRGYYEAVQSQDCDAIVPYFSDGFLADNGVDRDEVLESCRDDLTVEDSELQTVEVVEENGDHATVEVTWTGDESGEVTEEFEFVREDGRWLIESITTAD